MPTAMASSRVSTPSRSAVTTSLCRATGSVACGSPPCAAIIARHRSIAVPSASLSAGVDTVDPSR